MSYSDQLRDPRWQKRRLEVLSRDNFTCRDCAEAGKTVSVHHCHYCKGAPWNTPIELLLTLCDDCHDERGAIEASAREALGRLFARMTADDVKEFGANLSQLVAAPDSEPWAGDYKYVAGLQRDFFWVKIRANSRDEEAVAS